MSRWTIAVAALVVAVVPSAPVAHAKDDDRREAEVSGVCSQGARWDLAAKTRDGRTEIEFDVDSRRRGQRWTYSISQDGTTVTSGARRTRGGSLRVRYRGGAGTGQSSVTARAQSSRTAEICLGTLQL